MSAGTQQAIATWTPAPRQLVMAYSVCRGITRTAAKNFYYAFLVLPRRKREALCAVYAFMRRCDDITDESAFRAINTHARHGIGILVRKTKRETEANLWLSPPTELKSFLKKWLAQVAGQERK